MILNRVRCWHCQENTRNSLLKGQSFDDSGWPKTRSIQAGVKIEVSVEAGKGYG